MIESAKEYAHPVAWVHINRVDSAGWREQMTRVITARTAPDAYTMDIVRRLVQEGRL